MTDKKIKKEIHKLIDEINDEDTLNILKEEITAYSTTSPKDILDELTPSQLKDLEDSIAKADRGDMLTLDEFKKSMNEWRTKLKSAKDSGQKH